MSQDFEEVANVGDTLVAADKAADRIAGGQVVEDGVEERSAEDRAKVTFTVNQYYPIQGREHATHLKVAIRNTALGIPLWRRRVICTIGLRRGRSIAPLRVRRRHWSATSRHLLLCLELMLLLLLKSRSPSFEQGSLNLPGCVMREDRPCFLRPRHWFFPGFQHLVQLPACLLVDQKICTHKGVEEIAAKEEGVRRANVLYHRIEYVQCWEFAIWGNLRMSQQIFL